MLGARGMSTGVKRVCHWQAKSASARTIEMAIKKHDGDSHWQAKSASAGSWLRWQ